MVGCARHMRYGVSTVYVVRTIPGHARCVSYLVTIPIVVEQRHIRAIPVETIPSQCREPCNERFEQLRFLPILVAEAEDPAHRGHVK